MGNVAAIPDGQAASATNCRATSDVPNMDNARTVPVSALKAGTDVTVHCVSIFILFQVTVVQFTFIIPYK